MLTDDKIEAPFLRDIELPPNANVLVVGAYKGDTVLYIAKHHPNVNIYAFEPQKWAHKEMRDKLRNREVSAPFIYSWDVGLGAGSRSDVLLYEFGTDAASILELPSWRSIDAVELVDARVLKEPGPWGNELKVDLCVMNIEGYEYTLIPYMLNEGILPKNWLIQFHFYAMVGDKCWNEKWITDNLLAGKKYVRTEIGKGWEAWHRNW